ncbi:MAG: ABC transporter ATP-binding protein [Nitrososphaerota archaeon]|nr:ABC transporter ATP-binding protein [Nitrososphaerota archaeon]MDG6955378.1 ABC transporter ATP-binding protein [Nitrososphaerota archaeon]
MQVHNLAFNYVGVGRPVLTVDSFHVDDGEVILIIGKSGGGKSTLVNCFNGVIPHIFHGNNPGGVVVYGHVVKETPLPKLSVMVGTLLQDPETQVLNYTVEEEVAFGPENLRLPPEEIRRRVDDAIATTDIEGLRNRETYVLSGGELQRVALAAVLAMKTKMLIMDEPTSNIDPEGTARVFQTLTGLKGKSTLIIVEHKLERALHFVDRVVLVDEGKIVFDIEKSKLVDYVEELHAAGIDVPEHYLYAKRFGMNPSDIDGIRKRIATEGLQLGVPKRDKGGEVILDARSLVEVPGKVLVDAEVTLRERQVLAVMGRNGAGKSTLLKSIMNFLDRQLTAKSTLTVDGVDLSRANIQTRGKHIAFVPQSFDLMLINKTVEDEVSYSLRKRGVKDHKQKTEEFLKLFGLQDFRRRDPLMLSVGQRRRVAMASALSAGVKIVMLDEPTSGQDFYHKEIIAREIAMLKGLGYSFIIVTHDAKFVYRYSDYMLILDGGKKVLEGTPEEVFAVSQRYSVIPPTEYYLRNPQIQIPELGMLGV